MKKTIFLLIMVLSAGMIHSQDTIYKTNGSRIIAKVTEINAVTIKYKFSNNGSELVSETNKSEIGFIVYQGGMKELYNPVNTLVKAPPSGHSQAVSEPALQDDGVEVKRYPFKNIVAINCFEIAFTNFSASYERIFKDGHLSIKIPFAVGLGGRPNQSNYTSSFGQTQYLQNRLYSGGIEFNAYPYGQTRSTFYLGLSFSAGSFSYYKDQYSTVGYSSGYYYQGVTGSTKHIGSQYAGMLHIGGYLGLSENILLGTKFAAGYKREETIELDYTIPKVQFDLNLAYRF